MRALSLVDQIAELRAALSRAQEAAAQGAAISLAGLDDEIAALASAAVAAPCAAAYEIAGELEALDRILDRIAAELRRRHDASPPSRTASTAAALDNRTT